MTADVTITVDGTDWRARITEDAAVEITEDGRYATAGLWRDNRIVDAPGDLPEDVYVALEQALAAATVA